jgi:hypothetical protein
MTVNDSDETRAGNAVVMDGQQRRPVVVRFVVASALVALVGLGVLVA